MLKGVLSTKKEEPSFWGSWKGRIIKAIAVDGAKTWNDIRDHTGLFEQSLNTALFEMYDLGILTKKSDGTYKVDYKLYKEYKKFFDRQRISEESVVSVRFSHEKQKDIVNWIDQWRKVKKLKFSLEHKHFFLEGRHLDDISKELISHAKSEVLVVNPYVDKCDLSDTLREASKHNIGVKLITRPPKEKYRRKEKYHEFLKKDGVSVVYNEAAHAKIIVIDRTVAIISSMNFYSLSSGGVSWEAGLISIEESVINSVVDSILRLIEKPESKELK